MLTKLKPLSHNELAMIHQKSVELLATTGMWFESYQALELFKKRGFKVDGQIVYFPQPAIEEALRTAPAEFTVLARNPNFNMRVTTDSIAFAPSGGSPFLIDEKGRPRLGTKADYENSLKLTQVLEALDFNRELVAPVGEVDPENVPLYELLASIKLTAKPYEVSFGAGIGMLAIAFGVSKEKIRSDVSRGLAYAIGGINPVSPLGMSEHESEAMMELSTYGIALIISPMPMAGLTAPCTLPGLLVTQNCEILGALVLSQMVNPGSPVIYGCIGTITDMRNVSAPIGAPEARIIEAAAAQMGKFYNLPTRGDVGLTDSNSCDFQAGAESAFNFLNAANCGLNVLPGLGTMGSWNYGSLEKLVLDAELVGYVKRYLRPLELSSEHLAIEVIKKVGPRGAFIAEDHTARHFKKEFYEPFVFSRAVFDRWVKEGRRDALARAHDKMLHLLDLYERPDLEAAIEKDLEKYAAKHYPVSSGGPVSGI